MKNWQFNLGVVAIVFGSMFWYLSGGFGPPNLKPFVAVIIAWALCYALCRRSV